jgi:purine-cytosine permease-like protein
MVVSSFAIGVLGKSLFYLGFVDAILVCLFFNLLGVLTVCFFSCFGPAFGLRQMVLSRFWFGWFPVKFSKWPYPQRRWPSTRRWRIEIRELT